MGEFLFCIFLVEANMRNGLNLYKMKEYINLKISKKNKCDTLIK